MRVQKGHIDSFEIEDNWMVYCMAFNVIELMKILRAPGLSSRVHFLEGSRFWSRTDFTHIFNFAPPLPSPHGWHSNCVNAWRYSCVQNEREVQNKWESLEKCYLYASNSKNCAQRGVCKTLEGRGIRLFWTQEWSWGSSDMRLNLGNHQSKNICIVDESKRWNQ